MKRIEEWLKKHPLIGLDTPLFIYHLEDHPRYAPLTDALFDSLEKGMVKGITSYLTLMEILTRPKAMGDAEAARDYEYYLTTFPNLKVYEMDLEVARKASDLRAVEKIKAPDAIQIATALVHGATGFLTNDRIFARIKEIEVLILDKLL
jgi:predicted nucleic acid-binding protein